MTEPAGDKHDESSPSPGGSQMTWSDPAPNVPATTRLTVVSPGPVNAETVSYSPNSTRPLPGDRIDDFELVRVLGNGSFGTVFLARQVSLGRLVALKVTSDSGHEARTLARLEHAHIVQVFSETVERQRGLRLLCMQLVPGATLERVLVELARRDRSEWSGRAILEILDSIETDAVIFDPTALREREALAGSDFIEAVCRLGEHLAEALAHAHSLGVLHRDIKPPNVLLNRYGRPFLTDFNVSAVTTPNEQGKSQLGGTRSYMAPEHLDAFLDRTRENEVDERADIYSLGILLYQALTGRRPFESGPVSNSKIQILKALATERRRGPPPFPPDSDVPAALVRVVRRCLEPRPEDRYPSAEELARALSGCRELRRIEKTLPSGGVMTRALQRRPFALGFLLVLLPHIIGGAANIAYNSLRIVERLTTEQQAAFHQFVLGYNAIAYPICMLLTLALFRPIWRVYGRLTWSETSSDQVVAARRAALRLPAWNVVIACLGWLPGGILFPLAIDLLASPISRDAYGHFLVSFTFSGLIALTYSFFAIQCLAIRVFYPVLWTDARDLRATARRELAGQQWQTTGFQALAVLIPLMAAVLMVGVGPEDVTTGYRTFRVLVTAMIGLGMIGLGLAMAVSRLVRETLAVLTASDSK
jgi:serine/threonine protein kinase